MTGILKRVAIAAVAVGSAAALTGVGAGAASAQTEGFGGFTSMSCEPGTTGSGQARMDCVIGSFFYLHHIRANEIAPGNPYDASTNVPCGSGGVSNTIGYNELGWAAAEAPNTKYRVTIVSCGGAKDVYKVDQYGNVTFVKTTLV